jgi:hypothetical protein
VKWILGKYVSDWRMVVVGVVFLFAVLVAMPVSNVRAMSAEQKRLFDSGVEYYDLDCESSDGDDSGGSSGGGIGVGNPWPGTKYLLPAKEGSAATEGSIKGAGKKTSNMLEPSQLGNGLADNLIADGKADYLKYYIAMQWPDLKQHGTKYDFNNQSDDADGKGNKVSLSFAYKAVNGNPKMVKVTRKDSGKHNGKSVYVSVLEGGPGVTAGGKAIWKYRNIGLSPDAMSALGFTGTVNPNPGESGWLTYEWAPDASPGPVGESASGSSTGSDSNCPDTGGGSGDYMNDNTFPFYKQGGQKWSGEKVCTGGSNIGPAGCGITSFAMAASAILGKKITPDMAAKTINVCTYSTSAAGFAPAAAKKYGFNGEKIALTQEAVEKAFKEGKMVLISVGVSKFTDNGHYLLLRGMTSSGKWKIANSNPKNDTVSNTREYKPSEITSVWHNTAAALWK